MKLLVLEFWGLGDLTFATPLLRAARDRYEITLVGKAHAEALLAPTFPEVRFIAFDAPWSAYRDKYALHKWNWPELASLVARLRREHFDAVVSVRNDPRDHLLMRLIGARRRFGFPRRGSNLLLTDAVRRSRAMQHKVEDWHDLTRALGLPAPTEFGPLLTPAAYRSPAIETLLAGVTKPILCLHPGARIKVRRWPEAYFSAVVQRLRERFDFHLLLVPDPDGYGSTLRAQADSVAGALRVGELVDLLSRVDLLLCNDSGPAHLAASCGRPAIALFGPTEPIWFRPWGDQHRVILRDICPWRPCFDYCVFSQPYCLTKLLPDDVGREIEEHIETLIARDQLPPALRKIPVEPPIGVAPEAMRSLGRVTKIGVPNPSITIRQEAAAPRSTARTHVGFYLADQNPHRDRTRGVTIYTDRLLAELAPNPALRLTAVVSRSSYRPTTPHIDLRELPIATDHSFRRLVSDQFHPLADPPVSFWHYPKGYLPPRVWPRRPTLGNVHDVILQHYADHHPRARSSLEYAYWLGMLKSSIPRFAAIFTLSEYSRQDILRFCERHRLRVPIITVSSAGMDWEITPPVAPAKDDYVLHLGSREPHKSTARLLAFWRQLEAGGRDHPRLLVLGELRPEEQHTLADLRTAEHRPPPARDVLLATINTARALLLPSEIEGFGLPALESYALLTPVVFVRDTAVHEVLGEDTPGAFSLADADSFFAAMSAAFALSPEEIRATRDRLAARFTWRACADATLGVYRQFADF